MDLGGLLLMLIGLAIVIFPETLSRIFMWGALHEGPPSDSGRLVYRIIGVLLVFAGVAVTIGM